MEKHIKSLVAIILMASGVALICSGDSWVDELGVFLMIWGNNIE